MLHVFPGTRVVHNSVKSRVNTSKDIKHAIPSKTFQIKNWLHASVASMYIKCIGNYNHVWTRHRGCECGTSDSLVQEREKFKFIPVFWADEADEQLTWFTELLLFVLLKENIWFPVGLCCSIFNSLATASIMSKSKLTHTACEILAMQKILGGS